MSEILNKNNIIFGVLFALISGYFLFKASKRLIRECQSEEWSLLSSTIGVVLFWFAAFGVSIGLLIGHNKF